MYMQRRRQSGEAPLASPEQFGLARLHLLKAEAFFQLVCECSVAQAIITHVVRR